MLIMGCGSSSDQRKTMPIDNRGISANGESIRIRPKRMPSYPIWFWKVPDSGGNLYAVGMIETTARPESSQKQAIADGVINLTRSLSARVAGGQGTQRVADRSISGGSSIAEELSPDMLKFVEEHHHLVATCDTPVYTFALLRLGGDSVTSASHDSSVDIPEKPKWVNVLPKSPGYIYASGESELHYRETTSWNLAERSARETLALSVESTVWTLTKRYRENARVVDYDYGITNITTDVQLNRAQVVERWKDIEYGVCHVLVRMPVSANSESVANLVRSVLAEEAKKDLEKEPKEETQRKSQQEIIDEVFDELDRLTNPDQ
jgi:hypothetical protein